MKIERIRGCLGSAGCQPAMLGSLPTNAGKLPALPNPET
jgi:hypothetical protein